MDDQQIIGKFRDIQSQLARERRARLHAWIPRALVIAAFAVFAVIWAQGLDVQNKQEADRQARRVEICEAINENRVLVDDVLTGVIKIAKANEDPDVIRLLQDLEPRLAPIDCTDAFNPDNTTTIPD